MNSSSRDEARSPFLAIRQGGVVHYPYFPWDFCRFDGSKGNVGFYEQFGFVRRLPEGPGMFKII
ncbi:hypothetical protein [Methanosarcina horonobensis]|uniref:hypothetical protein n=1 Tax=Methanosarcina horonobensis TaxID=418008 RepID=UPI00064EC8ED|nr:hypothetical protein [Methanosarcina horonobensis]